MDDNLPPVLQEPTSKERKYDRQLRLWGANGQAALEDAHVLFIPSGPMHAAGIETLKNLILPGIGNFTIVDGQTVTEADLGVNFFLTEDDIGSPRAGACVRWLSELNPDAEGHAIEENVADWLGPVESNPAQPSSTTHSPLAIQKLSSYTHLIVTTPLPHNQIESIRQAAADTPIFYITCTGFYSTFTIELPSVFPVVDTHPDAQSTIDLRLLEPWTELQEFAAVRTTNLDTLDEEEHGHIPYVILLLHYLNEWKSSHNGLVPQNYKEKTEFRECVRAGGRTSAASGFEENYEEAVGAVLKSLNSSRDTISSAVRAVLESKECQQLELAVQSNFFLIAHAISIFYNESGGLLPLSGTIPDMKAKSDEYIRLQSIYKAKARKDVESVMDILKKLASENATLHALDIEGLRHEVEAFCKCADHVKVLRGLGPLFEAPAYHREAANKIAGALEDEGSLLQLWFAFYTYHQLFGRPAHRSIPQWNELGVHSAAEMVNWARDTVSTSLKAVHENVSEEVIHLVAQHFHEIARAQHCELHNIAAVTGGMVAQEVIKIITKQYTPADNIVVYDGIRSKTQVFRFPVPKLRPKF